MPESHITVQVSHKLLDEHGITPDEARELGFKETRHGFELSGHPPVERKAVKVVIAVVSAAPYHTRREICREWMKQLALRNAGMTPPVVLASFFVGKTPERVFEPDTITLDCPDTYHGLCLKTKAVCQYALENYDFDYLFKCDDDTFVHVARLIEQAGEAAAKGEDYVGAIQGLPPFAEGGAGYFLSREAVEIVAAADAPAIGAEDSFVGHTLAAKKIVAVNDSRFNQKDRNHPHPSNNQITSHHMRSLSVAQRLQEEIQPTPKKKQGEAPS